MEPCPCGSDKHYSECCEPVISGNRHAETAEQLMRARYTAYAKAETKFLRESLLPDQQKDFDEKSSREWATGSEWQGLKIVETSRGGADDTDGEVEFIASYAQKGTQRTHHERATFRKLDGKWYFENGEMASQKPVVRSTPKVGRNDPCPCGSGKKHKKCCGA